MSNNDEDREDKEPHFEAPKTFPGFSKVLPLIEDGFFTQLRKQAFFWPALGTVVVGLVLLVLFQLMLSTKAVGYMYGYQFVLGVYLGVMILFAISRVAAVAVPFWLLLGTSAFTGLMLAWQWPLYWMHQGLSFLPLRKLAHSTSFVPAFVGHFATTGFLEELLKSLPLWAILISSGIVLKKTFMTDKQGRLHPLIAVVIGSASAIGFIVVETTLDYVPRLQQETDFSMGMMLLIPRLLTGICGHVAWTGIFAYFIGLSQFYKRRGVVLLVLVGWTASAFLHGLWNACQQTNLPLTGALIALLSFVMFVAYLYKAKLFFATPDVMKTFSIPLSAMPAMQTIVMDHQAMQKAIASQRKVSPFQTVSLGSFPSRSNFSSEQLPAVAKESGAFSTSGSDKSSTDPFVEAVPEDEKDLLPSDTSQGDSKT